MRRRVAEIKYERVLLAALTLAALVLRAWALNGKGLWYDEAATALMSRAPLGEILRFHWQAGFENPPLYILMMHLWTRFCGESEVALRLPSAFAGAALVPLTWQLVRFLRPPARAWRWISVALVASSPILVLYSQEARAYTLVVLLAMASLYSCLRLMAAPRFVIAAAWVAVNWLLLGMHYYAAVLIAVEGIFLLIYLVPRPLARGGAAGTTLLAGAASLAPLAAWVALSPGFRTTGGVVLAHPARSLVVWAAYLSGLWRDLGFGSVRWQPSGAATGYVLLLPLGLGVAALLAEEVRRLSRQAGGSNLPAATALLLAVIVLPVVSGLYFGQVATRYLLFISPPVYIVMGAGLSLLWSARRWAGAAGLLVAASVAGYGLAYYFGSYQKSEYREMAAYLQARALPAEVVLLEAPRQHLLARYYLPRAFGSTPAPVVMPIPPVSLTDYWPVTAPPVDPLAVDQLLRDLPRQHGGAWLVEAGEDEVDRGEFVHSFLTANAYSLSCQEWMDVRLCHFLGPASPTFRAALSVDYAGGLALRGAGVSLANVRGEPPWLLVQFDWLAAAKPVADYKVTLRLVSSDGRVVVQNDDFPIGPLLPPSTWQAGDRKPGYFSLGLPADLPAGEYEVRSGLYDPQTGQPVAAAGGGCPAGGLLRLALLEVPVSGAARANLTGFPVCAATGE